MEEITVGAEVFTVGSREDDPRTFDYEWVNGRVRGYGFTAKLSRGAELDDIDLGMLHRGQIEQFLAEVDPETGLLADVADDE